MVHPESEVPREGDLRILMVDGAQVSAEESEVLASAAPVMNVGESGTVQGSSGRSDVEAWWNEMYPRHVEGCTCIQCIARETVAYSGLPVMNASSGFGKTCRPTRGCG